MSKISKYVSVILGVGALLVILGIIFGAWGTIGAGERGVKTRLSAVVGTVQPGLYFKVPFIESVHAMDVKTRTINYDKSGDIGDDKNTSSNLFGASKDLQDVSIGVVVTYHIDPTKVTDIYAQYSSVDNYENNVIEPIVRQTVKSTSALYTAEELVTKRAEYSDKVNASLTEQFTAKSAVLENFSVTNFEFSSTYSNAIEKKVTAEQNALTEKNNLAIEEYKAQQVIAKAKGDAEAIRINSQAINSQGGADYVQLQAIKAWDGKLPTQMIPGGTVPFLNLKN